MDKVENQCDVCRGLGWLGVSDQVIHSCTKCNLFKTDQEAFVFVTTTCEQWQHTIALIFATRLLAEAVPVPPMQTVELEVGVRAYPVSAEETAQVGTVRVGADEKLSTDDGTTEIQVDPEIGGGRPPDYIGGDKDKHWVCSICGAPYGCCEHKGADMVDTNTRPFAISAEETAELVEVRVGIDEDVSVCSICGVLDGQEHSAKHHGVAGW